MDLVTNEKPVKEQVRFAKKKIQLISFSNTDLFSGIPRVNLRLWRETPQNPQQLSAFNSILPYDLPDIENPAEFTPASDPDFEQYLESKSYAEQKATAPTKEEIFEVPAPLSKNNYLHAYDNEPDMLWLDNDLFGSDKDTSDTSSQARSNSLSPDNQKILEELFKSAREEAFEDKELFY